MKPCKECCRNQQDGTGALDDDAMAMLDADVSVGPLIVVAPEAALRMAQPKPAAHKPRTLPQRIDWFRVITHLERSGYTIRSLADRVGLSKGWVEHLKNSPGAEPRFAKGEVLLLLWCDAMDKPWCDVPREKEVTYG